MKERLGASLLITILSGVPEAMWSGGGSHSKRALASQPSFFWAAIFDKTLLYGYSITSGYYGSQTSTLIWTILFVAPSVKAQNRISKRTYITWFSIWGVGTGGRARGQAPPLPQVFRKPKKCPFSGGNVPFAFVKNFVQIAFLTHGCCKATSACESLWLIECGAVN
jgi:hypothetical protein